MTDEDYMKIALKESEKCCKYGDVPVGAVLVKYNKIIAKSYNQKEKMNSVTGHAEILVINKGNKKLKNARLDGAILYTTKEPCLMCMGVILSARISKIVFGAKDKRFGTSALATDNNFNHKCECVGGVLEKECSEKLTNFFKQLRSENAGFRKGKNN